MPDQSIAGRLDAAETFARNLLADPYIVSEFTDIGRTQEELEQGQALVEAAQAAQRAQEREYAEQYDATEALQTARAAAERTYMRHLKLARIVFGRDAGARQALGLKGSRPENLSGWLDVARRFYANALASEDLLSVALRAGLTTEVLAAGKASVEAVAEAQRAQERETGEAQAATQARNAVLAALDAWLQEYSALARVLLSDEAAERQKLEALGLTAG